MAIIYAVVNQKGGVGKTTTAVNLSVYLAASGKRVLLIDLDSQGNATSSLGIDRSVIKYSSYDILLDKAKLDQAVLINEQLKLAIVPSVTALAAAEVELVQEFERERRLQQALSTLAQKFDYVLIDCPPSLGLLTVNALTACDQVLIPVQCEFLALEGLTQLSRTLQLVKQRLNSQIDIRGLIMTMYDPRTALAQQVVKEVEKHFGAKVFTTLIPRNVRLSEAPSHGQPIMTYAPTSQGAVAYAALAQEILRGDTTAAQSIPQEQKSVEALTQ